MRHYVVIGAGAAGISAIEAIRSQDSQGQVTLISEERYGYYSRPGLAYLLSDEISEAHLFPFSKEDFNYLQVKRVNARAMRIYPEAHRVELSGGGQLRYDRLLIATGSQAIRLQMPGIELEGVVKLDNLDDVHHIIKLARRGRTAVVIGGGITALELVEGLLARGVKVHYFLRDERYWTNILDETESHVVEDTLREDGAQIHYHTELAEILGKRGKLIGVRTKQGQTIPCDILAVAIGVRPRIDLATASGLQTDRGILVNEFLQTNAPDVFAAGDVGQVLDPTTGKTVLDSLWGPARSQGRYAGLNMAGSIVEFNKPIPFNVTRLAGLTTTIIGSVGTGGRDPDLLSIARGDSEAWREAPGIYDSRLIAAQSGFDVNRLRLTVGDNHLVGAFVMGNQTLSKPIQQLIIQRVDISPIRNYLLQPEQSLSEIIANYFAQWQVQYANQFAA